MTIFYGSRYSKTKGYTVPAPSGGVAVILNYRKELRISKDSVQHYKVKQGQRLDQIAYELFENAQYKDFILDANPQYSCELFIMPGDVIVIPSLADILGVMDSA